jgi:hypothetical protein
VEHRINISSIHPQISNTDDDVYVLRPKNNSNYHYDIANASYCRAHAGRDSSADGGQSECQMHCYVYVCARLHTNAALHLHMITAHADRAFFTGATAVISDRPLLCRRRADRSLSMPARTVRSEFDVLARTTPVCRIDYGGGKDGFGGVGNGETDETMNVIAPDAPCTACGALDTLHPVEVANCMLSTSCNNQHCCLQSSLCALCDALHARRCSC